MTSGLAAAAVVVVAATAAAVVGIHQAVVAAAAEQDQQDDDPPAAVVTKTVITHIPYLREFVAVFAAHSMVFRGQKNVQLRFDFGKILAYNKEKTKEVSI